MFSWTVQLEQPRYLMMKPNKEKLKCLFKNLTVVKHANTETFEIWQQIWHIAGEHIQMFKVLIPQSVSKVASSLLWSLPAENYQIQNWGLLIPGGLCKWPGREQPGESPQQLQTTLRTPGSRVQKGRMSGERQKLQDQCQTTTSPDWDGHLRSQTKCIMVDFRD